MRPCALTARIIFTPQASLALIIALILFVN
jgi:hypothetical protein